MSRLLLLGRHLADFIGTALVVAAYLVVSLPLLLIASAVSTTLECVVGLFDLSIGALGGLARRGAMKWVV